MNATRLQEVHQFIEARRFEEAKQLLHTAEKDAHYFRCLGLISFLEEDYAGAKDYLSRATALVDADPYWNELLERARQNEVAGIQVFVPDISHFSLESLNHLYTTLDAGRYPVFASDKPVLSVSTKINHALGNFLGSISSMLLEWFTEIWGIVGGYKGQIWTNWYRKSMFLGVLSLAYMRNQLNRKNLFSTYSQDEKKAFREQLGEAPPGAHFYRTANGTFNNPDNPIEGAAGTRFQRNIHPDSSDKMRQEDILQPNPRLISRMLLTRKGEMKKAPFLNMLAAAWIQFQNHDWISHGEPRLHDCYEIEVPEDDPIRKVFRQTKMFVGKTPQDPTRTGSTPFRYTFINEATHWWDGSQIYGSDEQTVLKLRSQVDGKMKLSHDGTLPLDTKGIELTGLTRNWWVGLSMFHTLFVKEHNAICDHLKLKYADWNDDRLFQTARLINSALMAKIHTLEWNSAINPNHMIYNGNHSNWYGFLTTLLRKKEHWHTVAHLNIRNTELGGVVGNPIKRFSADFGLTQEFVEAYRIHSMLPETLHIRDLSNKDQLEELPFVMSRQSGSAKCMERYGMSNLLYSFGHQHPGQVVLHNYPRFMQELSIPGNPIYDMGAVDILRARERGVPRYNEFRRQLGLNPVRCFEDLTSDQEVINTMKQIYGEHAGAIEDLDFMIGTLAEDHRPTGFAFGETMFQLFLLNATRRLQADRFYTDCYTPEFYTEEGMQWIDTHSLKSVLLRHYPELNAAGLGNIMNAFEPWDEGAELDPSRHPLRAFDKTLKKDPWRGDFR